MDFMFENLSLAAVQMPSAEPADQRDICPVCLSSGFIVYYTVHRIALKGCLLCRQGRF